MLPVVVTTTTVAVAAALSWRRSHQLVKLHESISGAFDWKMAIGCDEREARSWSLSARVRRD